MYPVPPARLIGLLTAIAVLSFLPAYGQPDNAGGILLEDTTDTPVPYATVELTGKGRGTVSDSDGQFQLSLSGVQPQDTVTIRNLGFVAKSLSVAEWLAGDTIRLHRAVYELAITTVRPVAELPVRQGTREPGPNQAEYGMSQWMQVAVYLDNAGERSGVLREVGFYIPRSGKAQSPFRVRIYRPGTAGEPAADLLLTEVILAADKKGGWVRADLSAYQVIIPTSGYWVAMEWINAGDRFHYVEKINGKPYRFYGPKLGALLNQEPPRTWIKHIGKPWKKDDNQIGDGTFGYRNAMIYATVSWW
jgi:hypothetical protein